MNLDETFQLLALQIPVDPDELIRFAAEDRIGGWDLDKGGWPTGSLWSVEGKVLYALTRLLRPDLVVEIGTHRGCSTTHIATALDINDNGVVATIDTAPGVGDLIPSTLDKRVEKAADNGVEWLNAQPDNFIDIIYEDADHSAETSANIAKLATAKLKPGGLLITHDAAHDYAWLGDGSQVNSDVGATIRRGLEMALGDRFRVYRTDPSDCGFALWQKPSAFATNAKPMDTLLKTDIYSIPADQNPALAQAISNLRENDPDANQETAAVQTNDEPQQTTEAKSLHEMTRAELEAFAEKANISLSGARTNAERVAKIAEAQAAKE